MSFTLKLNEPVLSSKSLENPGLDIAATFFNREHKLQKRSLEILFVVEVDLFSFSYSFIKDDLIMN